jgi:uncharacterized protein with ATP-grasp and redox domains
MKQALKASRIANASNKQTKDILSAVGQLFKDLPMDAPPPFTGEKVYNIVSKITNNADPYESIKLKNIKKCKSLVPHLQDLIDRSEDPLLTAIRIAIAGNVIDHGVNREFDIEQAIEDILKQEFAYFDYEKFKSQLDTVDEILYLGDNSGESVFDKLLLKQLGKKVIYAVKENPIINDTTQKEAGLIGINDLASVISSGSNAPGTILDTCSQEFRDIFNNSSMIISKGQGNFEGLSEEDAPIFFLLRAKCPVIARDLDVEIDSIIFKSS